MKYDSFEQTLNPLHPTYFYFEMAMRGLAPTQIEAFSFFGHNLSKIQERAKVDPYYCSS